MNGSYFGPELSCAKCNTIMLAGVVQTISISPAQFGGPNFTGTAVMPGPGTLTFTGMSSQVMSPQQQTFFTWPPKTEVEDAYHVSTCACTECKCKAK